MNSWAIDMRDVVDPTRLAESVIDDVINEGRKPQDQQRRLTVREKFAAVLFEAQLICTAASNIKFGIELTAEDTERCWVARSRIEWIFEEA
jgi:hypothetical protein